MTTMKRSILVLIGGLVLGASACDDGLQTSLTNGGGTGTAEQSLDDTSGGAENTHNHSNDPAGVPNGVPFQPADPAEVRAVGSPEVTSRLHSCGKMTVSSIGKLLQGRGLTGGGQRPGGAASGKAIFDSA